MWIRKLLLQMAVGLMLAGGLTYAASPVVYLRTEFLPYDKTVDRGITFRLGRELVRQAALLSLREELHVACYDETLGEQPPEDVELVELMIIERADLKRKWNVKLIAYPEDGKIHKVKPLWEKTYEFRASAKTKYADFVPQMEAAARSDFLEAFAAAGIEKNPEFSKHEEQEAVERLVDEEIAKQVEPALSKVDFIAQLGALRLAHRAMAQGGESDTLLPVLVRGYANLSMLTKHQWNATSEVFAARAWLYAQRMVAAAEGKSAAQQRLALWHRAYAWGLGGTLHNCLADLKTLNEQEGETSPPAWASLLEPYCRWQRDRLQELGEGDESLKPWATRLSFQLTDAYRLSKWSLEAGIAVARASPTAYGVYADLAHHGGSLEAERSGAYWAPAALSRYGIESLSELPEMPKEILEFLPTGKMKAALLQPLFKDPEPRDQYSAAFPFVAARLVELEPLAIHGTGISWSALAYLLDEEQYVQIANAMKVATNATERSLASEVDAVLPLVAEHPYASYIDSYRYNRRRQKKQLVESMAGMEIRDPRMNMSAMLVRAWNCNHDRHPNLGARAWRHADRSFTMSGLLEVIYRDGENWAVTDEKFSKVLSREFNAIVPSSEVGVRMFLQTAKNPKLDRLKTWEAGLVIDPVGFRTLGHHYYQLKEMESSERCYEQSMKVMPTLSTARSLAALRREMGDLEGWEQTLLDFLETEDVGLTHAQARSTLAYGLTRQGRWLDAKEPAVKAAETYAAWGLECASIVCEGLAQWQESEHWMRAASENYSSSSGHRWYLWCRRTGRGNEREAEALAEKYFATPLQRPTRAKHVERGVFRFMQGDREQALEHYEKALAFKPTFTCTFMVARLARELEKPERAKEVIANMQKEAENYKMVDPDDPSVVEVGQTIMQIMQTDECSEELLEETESELKKIMPVTRGAFAYLLAVELNRIGQEEAADLYWRRALIIPGADNLYATLAGVELVERHGTSRPDDDELSPDTLWPLPEE